MEYSKLSTDDQMDSFGQLSVNSADWRESLRHAWYNYMVGTLGLPESIAIERADVEVSGSRASAYCDSLEAQGMIFAGKTVADIGCGLGSMTVEMARRGARVIGIEPSEAWRNIAQARVESQGLLDHVSIIAGDAERLPLSSGSVDYVTSFQVLEHVARPRSAIAEMRRALRGDGLAYVSCENYLAFREQHYRVAWFPLLPKPIGALYLRLRSRDPQFLVDHVTYTTYPSLIWNFVQSGMWSRSWPNKYQNRNPVVQLLLLLRLHRSHIFHIGFVHFLQPFK